jgi:hypothetical protein
VVLQRLVFTTLWNGFFGVFILLVWPHRATTPIFIQGILGFFVLIGLGMAWDLIARLLRTLAGKTAVVEVDRLPIRRGETLQLRVFQSDPASLATLQLALVGENTVTETRGNTTITRTGRCCTQEIFSSGAGDLDGASLDRAFSVTIPADGPSGEIRWSILVAQQLKQGGGDFQAFPLQVEG